MIRIPNFAPFFRRVFGRRCHRSLIADALVAPALAGETSRGAATKQGGAVLVNGVRLSQATRDALACKYGLRVPAGAAARSRLPRAGVT